MTGGLLQFGTPGETFGEAGDVFAYTPSPTPSPSPIPPQIDLPSGSRLETFGYMVLDPSLNVIGEINPVVVENNSTAAPRIRASIQGSSYRVLDGVQLIPEQADLNPRTDRIAPTWVDVNGDVYPLGVYRLVDLSTVQFSGGDHIEVTGADESAVHHTKTTRALSWPRSFEVAEIIPQLAGILNVPVTDADPTTAVLGEAISFPAGSADWFDVYCKVAQAGGFLPPYFDLSGAWRWRTAPEWESALPDHIWSTHADSPLAQRKIVQQTLARSVTLLDSFNIFYAVNTAAKGAPIRGVYQLPASAPNSIERTGVKVADWQSNSGLGSQAAADAAARAMAAGAMDDIGQAQAQTYLDPRISIFDSVLADDLLYRVVGYSVRLSPGETMSHDLRRVFRAGDPEGQWFAGSL